MVVKIINKDHGSFSEEFFEHPGSIGVLNYDLSFSNNIYITYGHFPDKIIVFRDYYGLDSHMYLAIDSNLYLVFLLNDKGQTIQKLV